MRTRATFPMAVLCGGVLMAGCSAEPMTDREIEQLRSFGPGLQRVGEGLAEAGESLGRAVCRVGRAAAYLEGEKEYPRRCRARRTSRN